MTEQLVAATKEIGHSVELIQIPFTYCSESNIETTVRFFESFDPSKLDMHSPDRIIALKWPAYYSFASPANVWLMHQHRAFYDLWDDGADHSPGQLAMREETIRKDSFYLRKYDQVYTISRNVSNRLLAYNGVPSEPIYQPPSTENLLHCSDNLPIIFCPSRIESLKRQDLLVRAMARVKPTALAVIAGTGGMAASVMALAQELNVADRILFTGQLSTQELIRYFGMCRAVFFAPIDEDYGFVTLEAMIASKPVITCTDSGGPLEFIHDGVNGHVVPPDENAVAEAITRLIEDPHLAVAMGKNGAEMYRNLNMSWHAIADRLCR